MGKSIIYSFLSFMLICVYINTLIPASLLRNLLGIIYLFIGFLYTLKLGVKKQNNNTFFILIIFFVLLNVLSWYRSDKVIMGLEGLRNTTELLIPTIRFGITYSIFYYGVLNNLISRNFYIKLSVALLVTTICCYVVDYSLNSGVGISNYGYIFVCLFPCLGLIWDRKKISIALLLLFFAVTLIATKRGAIICALIAIILYFYFYYNEKKTFSRILLVFLVLLLIVVVGFEIYLSNTNFQVKFERTVAGDSSGRDVIYKYLWYSFISGDSMDKLFGSNFMGAALLNDGLDAHSDWLEILLSTGYSGAVVYILMFISILSFAIKYSINMSAGEKYMLYSSTLIWFIKTIFSMGYTVSNTLILIIFIAYVMANIKKRINYENNSSRRLFI